jgi:hypothetical protein
MVRVRDFTKLPVGFEIFDSVILECPKCGKRGLAGKTDNGLDTYTHSETVGFDGDNPVVHCLDER